MATSYLSLTISLSSDTLFSDYVSAQDSNWQKVDTFASGIAGSVSALGSNITALGSSVTSLSSALGSAMSDITTLSSSVSALGSDITTLSSNVSDAFGAISSVQSDLSSAVTSLSSMITALTGMSGSAILTSANWIASVYTLTVSNLGANDAIFIKGLSRVDKRALTVADIITSATLSTVTLTALESPSTDIAISYYIVRGASSLA